jgi:hypothetical protein
MFLLVKKVQEIVENGQSPAWESDAADATGRASTQASVHALKDAFGGRLRIVYVPEVHVQHEPEHVPEETDLLAACAHEGVRCTSMRGAMVQARDTGHHMLTGFNNSEPGTGHLNVYGHEALARLIWDTLRTKP